MMQTATHPVEKRSNDLVDLFLNKEGWNLNIVVIHKEQALCHLSYTG